MTNLAKFGDPVEALYFFMEEVYSEDCVTCGAQGCEDHSYGCAGCFAYWLMKEADDIK